eukprot:350391-Chlamydomonas_euryale.AAC.5
MLVLLPKILIQRSHDALSVPQRLDLRRCTRDWRSGTQHRVSTIRVGQSHAAAAAASAPDAAVVSAAWCGGHGRASAAVARLLNLHWAVSSMQYHTHTRPYVWCQQPAVMAMHTRCALVYRKHADGIERVAPANASTAPAASL